MPDRAVVAGVDRTRRSILGLVGAGLATGLAGGLGGIERARAQQGGGEGGGPVELTFAFGPDDSGSLDRLVEAFNAEHDGRIRVTHRRMARASDAYYRQLRSDFEVGSSDIDVFGADIVWTAEFATRRWVRELSDLFDEHYARDDFLVAPLRTVRYRRRVWGIPWFTDAGMLYYRRDLLEASGFDAPPTTWEELAEMAARVREDAGTEHGFVFQGDAYEGGVANALEFIWNAGGRVLTGNVSVAGTIGGGVIDPNVVVVDNRDAAIGLDTARRLIADGVAPEAVSTFRELDAHQVFLAGDAVFMRNWPYAYGLIDEEESSLTSEQIGVAPVPTEAGASRSYGCLGGWNLMVSAFSDKRDAAETFVRFASAPEQQRARARDGGFLPTLAALYEDEALAAEVPIVALGKEAVRDARTRPVSPYYADLSPRLALAFNRVLRGELDGDEAVARLQREMQTILRRRR